MNNVRTSFGLMYYARSWRDHGLEEHARAIWNLALAAPARSGIFPSIFAGDGKHPGWVPGSRVWRYTAAYHTPDAVVTGWWMLAADRFLNEEGALFRERCEGLGDFFRRSQLPSVAIPTWVKLQRDGTPRAEPVLAESASSAAAGMFLVSLFRTTGREEYLEAARRIADFIIENVFPRHAWFDTEVFFSCSPKPLFGQTLVEIIEGLEACWAFFGGVPQYLGIDNFTTAVAGTDPLNPRLTRGFIEYAQHRGFIVDPTRVRHPQDKPKVESGIRYVRERFFKGGSFHDLADLRIQARHWCLEKAGQRVHGTTYKLPLVVFKEEERAKLLLWDVEPYDVPDWRTVTVHPDHHVSYKYALYSAPSSTCPPVTKLEVRGDSKLVRFYHRGLLIKTHPRQCRGGRSTDQEDYPPELTAYIMRSPDYLRRRCAELGESVGIFAGQLLGGPLPWAKMRQAQKLLRLGERYTASRLDTACRKALEVDLIDVRCLERILIEALEEEAVTSPAMAVVSPPGCFARHGSVFAIAPDMFSEVSL